MAHSLPPPVSVPPPISGGESYAVEMEGFPYDCSRDELMDVSISLFGTSENMLEGNQNVNNERTKKLSI